MNSMTLPTLFATVASFVAARYLARWLFPLIPIDGVRARLAEPASSSLLAAVVAVCAGLATMNALPSHEPLSTAVAQLPHVAQPRATDAAAPGADAIARLAAFVRKAERNAPAPMTPFPPDHPTDGRPPEGLADVDTMIARLAARLEVDGRDVEGWRTLGWSYFATENFSAAAEAYHRALELRPDDGDLKAAAAEARARAEGESAKSAAPLATSADAARN